MEELVVATATAATTEKKIIFPILDNKKQRTLVSNKNL